MLRILAKRLANKKLSPTVLVRKALTRVTARAAAGSRVS
jgi:hypothetical protein